MKKVSITEKTEKALRQIYKEDNRRQVQERCLAIILNSTGVRILKIAEQFAKTYRTVWSWIKRWEVEGFNGLYDKKGRGRKQKLSIDEKIQVLEILKENPRSTKKHLEEIEEQLSKKISHTTVKRILRSYGYKWKRIRKCLSKIRDEEDFRACQEEMESLKELEDKGFIDLYYSDEVGFSRVPVVPYAWQKKGKEIRLTPSQSSRYNVFGIMQRNSSLRAYGIEGNINAKIVTGFIDDFCNERKNQNKIAYLIIDNAPIHNSALFRAKEKEWEEKNVRIKRISSYSPELNLIEILWKKIKYEWLPLVDYTTMEELIEQVDAILLQVGVKYEINFE